MHRRANTTIGIIIIALAAISAIAAIISVVLQYNENHAAYERTIQESCQARGYETATFPYSQPNCCRKDNCFPYETAMRYGPGYEPATG
jgi:hypothetical protein